MREGAVMLVRSLWAWLRKRWMGCICEWIRLCTGSIIWDLNVRNFESITLIVEETKEIGKGLSYYTEADHFKAADFERNLDRNLKQAKLAWHEA
jgi:hypothetical protein